MPSVYLAANAICKHLWTPGDRCQLDISNFQMGTRIPRHLQFLQRIKTVLATDPKSSACCHVPRVRSRSKPAPHPHEKYIFSGSRSELPTADDQRSNGGDSNMPSYARCINGGSIWEGSTLTGLLPSDCTTPLGKGRARCGDMYHVSKSGISCLLHR